MKMMVLQIVDIVQSTVVQLTEVNNSCLSHEGPVLL